MKRVNSLLIFFATQGRQMVVRQPVGRAGVSLVEMIYEEPSGERPVKFAHQTTLDMGRFREFCQSSGAPTS